MSKEKSTAEVDQPSTAIQRAPRSQLLTVEPQALLQTALENNQAIDVIEKLVGLAERVQKERARQAWYTAMAQFQEACPPVLKTKRANAGSYKFTYAPLSEIMEKISPVLGQFGLSVSYSVKNDGQKIVAVCQLSHEMGHTQESGEVPIPIDVTTPGPSGAQRIGIAMSYAKRYALLAITGIAPQDEEGAAEETSRDNAGVSMPRRASEQEPPAGERSALSGKQISRLWAIAHDSGKKLGKSSNEVNSKVNALLGLNGATSVTELNVKSYEVVCAALEAWGADAP